MRTPVAERAERRAIIALVAVFVLLVQGLFPTFAMAAYGPGGMPICSEAGQTAGVAGDPAVPSPAGHQCQHCVCAAPAADPPQAATVAAVAYWIALAPVTETPRGERPQARAPPRPPGQGPPAPNA